MARNTYRKDITTQEGTSVFPESEDILNNIQVKTDEKAAENANNENISNSLQDENDKNAEKAEKMAESGQVKTANDEKINQTVNNKDDTDVIINKIDNNEIDKQIVDSLNNSQTEYYTHTGRQLTERENQFIDLYIKTNNLVKSYRDAGYNPELRKEYIELRNITKALRTPQQEHRFISINSMFGRMSKLLYKKDYIQDEINYRMNGIHSENIASGTEIMQYFTAVMRGEVQDQFGMDAPLSERTKAAQELAKRVIDIPKNSLKQSEVKLTIVRPQ